MLSSGVRWSATIKKHIEEIMPVAKLPYVERFKLITVILIKTVINATMSIGKPTSLVTHATALPCRTFLLVSQVLKIT